MGLRKWIAWVVAGTVSSTLLGSGPVIGVVSAEGSFRLDNVAAVAHATLLDGTEIQSDASTPRLQLKDGAWLLLATSSRVKIGGRRMAIEQGTAEIGGAARYDLEAGTLHIKPANNRALVRVQVNGERQVLVAAAGAPALVYTGAGLLVAKVRDGATLSFDPQAGPATTAQVPGCLLSKGGRYIVVLRAIPRLRAIFALTTYTPASCVGAFIPFRIRVRLATKHGRRGRGRMRARLTTGVV